MSQWNELTLQRLRKGDIGAQEICYSEFSPAVYTAIFKICRNKELANDLLHDSFLDAFTHIARFKQNVSFLAWIKRIAINNTFNAMKKKDFLTDDSDVELMSDEPIYPESHNRLEQLMTTLSAEHRAVLWLYVVEQYKHQEIAQMLGQSESYSKSIISRCLKRLRQQLEGNEHD